MRKIQRKLSPLFKSLKTHPCKTINRAPNYLKARRYNTQECSKYNLLKKAKSSKKHICLTEGTDETI